MSPTQSFTTLDHWLPWLESLSPREIVLGLERVHTVLDRLDIARPGLVITVAGTNGKGSSIAMLEAILSGQGICTGSYTSPHVSSYNERTRIAGRPADDSTILAALRTVEAARGDTPLTFFEFGTLATLVAFTTAGVDAWLLEVGMGGRLDAVNAIEPDGCLITNVALDHCSWLGEDIESIAAEKAGIMRPAKPVVFGSATVPGAVTQTAAATGSELIVSGRDFKYAINTDRTWSWQGRCHSLHNIAAPALSGDVQYGNAASVLALLEALCRDDLIDADDVGNALAAIRLDGRFQRFGTRWILDVAHNPAAAEVLATQLAAVRGQGRIVALVGMLADKDIAGYAEALARAVDRFIAVDIDASRGAGAQDVAQQIASATGKPCQVIANLDDALSTALARAGEDDQLLITGSFYVIDPAIRWIERHDGGGS